MSFCSNWSPRVALPAPTVTSGISSYRLPSPTLMKYGTKGVKEYIFPMPDFDHSFLSLARTQSLWMKTLYRCSRHGWTTIQRRST